VIVTIGPRFAAVSADEPTAVYLVERVRCETVDGADTVAGSAPARAVVEILRQNGGLAPRALVGGIFVPSDGSLTVKVGSARDAPASPATCKSQLWRQPFVAGLPEEFAGPVMTGIVRRPRLPSGDLSIDRAGYDPVESSPFAFELAAELLCVVLAAQLAGQDVESAVRDTVASWS
jgi:hypothetical protein